MSDRFQILETEARSILTATSGFIAQAGFTHSLTPARNCTFACTYCYVPTMGIYGGLKPEDWKRWGQFTTFKANAAQLLARELRPRQIIYCSPLVDPYQPAEESEQLMPRLLETLIARPPRVFTIQTRGPLILRDIELIQALAQRHHGSGQLFPDHRTATTFAACMSPTARRSKSAWRPSPNCGAPAFETYATLAPLLPCGCRSDWRGGDRRHRAAT